MLELCEISHKILYFENQLLENIEYSRKVYSETTLKINKFQRKNVEEFIVFFQIYLKYKSQ